MEKQTTWHSRNICVQSYRSAMKWRNNKNVPKTFMWLVNDSRPKRAQHSALWLWFVSVCVLSQKYSSDVIIYFMHIYFVVTSTKALSNHQFSISFNWRPLCHLGEYVKKFSLPSERRINIKITMMDERQKKSNTEKKPREKK